MKILILEDQLDHLEMIQTTCINVFPESEIHIAHKMLEALNFVQYHQYDLVTIDLKLPDGNGLNFAKFIRENPENKNAFLIFISGNSTLVTAFEAYDKTGCFKFLEKPIQESTLSAVLLQLKQKLPDTKEEIFAILTSAEGHLRLPLKDLRYFTIEKSFIQLYTHNETYAISRLPMQHFLEHFPTSTFVQISRFTAVSEHAVRQLKYDHFTWKVKLDGIDEWLEVSLMYQNAVKSLWKGDFR